MRVNRSIDGKTVAQVVMFSAAAALVAVGCFYPQMRAVGGYGQVIQTPPAPPPVPPPPPPVFIPPPPPNTFTPPIITPTDVTSLTPSVNIISPGQIGQMVTPAAKFPGIATLGGSTDFILVKSKDGSLWSKVNAYAASLSQGTLLVAVRKPSNTGMVTTPIGDVAITSNCDALITYEGPATGYKDGGETPVAWGTTAGGTGGGGDVGVLRVLNIDGTGESCKVKLTGGAFDKLPQNTFTLNVGVELIASPLPLTNRDMRPNDGVARRKPQMLAKNVAVNRVSVESVLKGSDLIANMSREESGSKENRVISDMSKMAAVLNQVHGNWGYEGAQK